MSTLLSCPFCGGKPIEMTTSSNERDDIVGCSKCYTEGPEPLLDPGTGERLHARERWNRRPIESALRSRVEALEGALRGARKFALAQYGEADTTPESIDRLVSRIDAALKPDKGERCPACGRPWDMRRFNACECGAVIQQPDKGERCGGTGAIPRGELPEGAIRRACDGCPDCREERCETCGGMGEVEDRWLEPTHHPFCDGSCAQGCPVPAERHERAPCPDCSEAP